MTRLCTLSLVLFLVLATNIVAAKPTAHRAIVSKRGSSNRLLGADDDALVGGTIGRGKLSLSPSTEMKERTNHDMTIFSSKPTTSLTKEDGHRLKHALETPPPPPTTTQPGQEGCTSHCQTMLQRIAKITTRILHPSLVSSYCVAREMASGAAKVNIPVSEIISMYCVHVFVFGADRLGDLEYDQTLLSFLLTTSVGVFAATANSVTTIAGLYFTGALVLYPLVKRVPYLKCLWVPLAFTMAAGVGCHSVAFSVAAFLYYLGNCAACDIGDVAEDTRKGISTFATLLGAKRVACMSSVLTASSSAVLFAWYTHHAVRSSGGNQSSLFGSLLLFVYRPATAACILTNFIYSIGLMHTTRARTGNAKDLDMLNTIPVAIKLIFN